MGMRFLLTAINAKYIHSNLAVYSLRATAAAGGIPVEIAEFTINHYVEDILKELYRQKPHVLFFSCYIWNWEYVKELAAECRKIMPQTPVWVGGPEVSYDADRILKENPAISGVLLGEGEESFPRLLEYYLSRQEAGLKPSGPGLTVQKENEDGKSRGMKELEGVAYRDGEEIFVNPQRHLPDLDKTPFPYIFADPSRGDIPDAAGQPNRDSEQNGFSHKILYYESSRGCPFSCSYCLSSIEKTVRFRDMDKVKRELDFFLDAKAPQVKFVDRTFNCQEAHALEIWTYLLEHDNGITNFHFEIGADLLTDAQLALMKRMRPGLIQLETGVQSVNPRTLKEIRRTMYFAKAAGRVREIKGFGNIHQHLDLIAGLPYEGLESFAESFDAVYALEPEQLQLGFLKVLKGSRMHRNASEYGILYREKPPYEVLSTAWLSYGELTLLKSVEHMVEIYYNSGQFFLTLSKLVPLWPSAFSFYRELADYYQEQGFFKIQHSRARRYEILLDFISEKMETNKERFRELLTADYYLREKAKSRPAFAGDLSPYREEIREIQKRFGKDRHVEVGHFREGRKCGPRFWIFDYGRRNPLTRAAERTEVKM